MLRSYLPVAFLLFVAGAFAVLSVAAARFLSPKDPSAAKLMPYECGIAEIDEPSQRFPVRFYRTALLFVIFDVEVIILYPWAVSFRSFPVHSLLAVTLFLGILFVAFIYEWRKGGLEWD